MFPITQSMRIGGLDRGEFMASYRRRQRCAHAFRRR